MSLPSEITATAGTDSITVAIIGEDEATHTVLYKLAGDTAWTTGGTREGDGDVVISDLSGGAYQVIVYSTLNDETSAPSNLATAYISTTTQDYIEQAFVHILRNDATVSALVEARIYPQMFPQKTVFPALRYNQISGIRSHTLTDTVDCVQARFQVDTASDTLINGRILADAVRNALNDYSGTVGNITIQNIHMIDESDYFYQSDGLDQSTKYGKTQDYYVWYNED